jgi:hypothetical protein
MQTFIADPRNRPSGGGDACNSCCCEMAYGRPGETNLWSIMYGHWVAGISGPGLVPGTSFEIAKLNVVTPSGSNQPPVNKDYVFATRTDMAVAGSVATGASDVDGSPLTYGLMGLYGPTNGIVDLVPATGAFVYTPRAGFNGYDKFFVTTSDGVNVPVINKVEIAVSPVGVPAIPLPPKIDVVNIPRPRLSVNKHYIQFPVEISPAAMIGDRYRVSIRQPASDCDGNTFHHIFCADLTIGKC